MGLPSGSRSIAVALGCLGSGFVHSGAPAVAPIPVAMVSIGGTRICVLSREARGYCWQTGEGPSPASASSALLSQGLDSLRAIATGGDHACALSAAGEVLCWGANRFGQLTGPSQGSWDAPVRIREKVRFASVAAGGDHTCALSEEGRAYCWGDQWDGAVGAFPVGQDIREPFPIGGGLRFRKLSAGLHHTCGISTGGGVYCWGRNARLGTGKRGARSSFTPVRISGSDDFTTVGAGADMTCAVNAEGKVWCWGLAGNSADSRKAGGNLPRVPGLVETQLRFTALAVGDGHACGLTGDGIAWCWKPGSPEETRRRAGKEPFATLSVGRTRACGVSTGGRLSCWDHSSVAEPVDVSIETP